MSKENKIKFGLKNVHYATFTETGDTITYDKPERIPGGVELALDPRGDLIEFYADDMLYYSAENNQGYEGTLNVALIPESFAVAVLGEELNEDGVLTERADAKTKPFALMFEFDGDQKATRHLLYHCTASRPSVEGETKGDSPEPQTDELSFVASARPTDYAVKTKTTATTDVLVYNGWYESVYDSTPTDPVGEGA